MRVDVRTRVMGSDVISTTSWRIGTHVRARGRRWRIDGVTTGEDCEALRLTDLETADTHRSLTVLTPFDRPVSLDRPSLPLVVRPRRWLHELDRALIELRPYGSLAATSRSRIRLIPYQLEAALAMLRHGATRILIADAVGLGKTIQAGVMILELSHQADTFRGLVLVPAGLREQWSAELATHFGLTSVRADSAWLKSTTSDRPAHVNPWSLPGLYISSHDFVKRPEALRPLEDVTWDLVVVDEAHAAGATTDRRVAIHAIAQRSRRVVLLTATPNADDPAALSALCRIGSLHQHDPVWLFARARSDVDATRPRKSAVIAVRLSNAELQMHHLLDRYSVLVWKEATARKDERARLVSIILRKRALSSAQSLVSSVRRRIALLSTTERVSIEQLCLPLADEDPLDDDEPGDGLGIPGLSDAVRERRWLTAILETASRAARAETKIRTLLRLLRRIRQPAIVFTEYRDTLVRLERHLSTIGRPVLTLHGGLSPSERAHVTQDFNKGRDVLLATDAAAEGLNLHHHCRVVIHYELPWNPARLEQRAGRVDRLGQDARVHEIALVAADTAERLVVAPLVARAVRARSMPGGSPLLAVLAESRVADAVMAMTIPAIVAERASALAPSDAIAVDFRTEAEDEVRRLTEELGLIARSERRFARHQRREPIVSRILTRQTRLAGLFLIFRLLVERCGRRIHGETVTVQVPGLQALSVIDDRIASMRDRVSRLDGVARARSSVRDAAIAAVHESAARRLVQPGLFERRTRRNQDAPRPPDAPLIVGGAPDEDDRLRVESTLLAVLHVIRRSSQR
jgi:superfamily II DNA or RNA helicase